jgi:membrane protein DedA with SNARE-associated domain
VEAIQELLMSYPPGQISLVIMALMFGTSLGVVPNNTDMTMVVAGSLAGIGMISFPLTAGLATLGLIIGETIMFLLGQRVGPRFYKLPIIEKVMPHERYDSIGKLVHKIPMKFLMSIRFTPVGRPFVYLAFGSFRPGYKVFFRNHFPLTASYCLTILTTSFFMSKVIMKFMAAYKFYVFGIFFVIWFLLIRSISREIKKEILAHQ